MTHIASSVPGRIRLKDMALRDPETLARLEAALNAQEGVSSTRGNAAVGSVVVHYERSRVKPGQIVQATVAILGSTSPTTGRPFKRRVNRYAKLGALATLTTSLVLAASGRKYAHAIAGGAFLACLGTHLYIHRRSITR